MRVVVCFKHVPDVVSQRRIEDGRLVRGEDDTLNELDENAIEAAVQAVEDLGGEVIAVTMGPEDAEDSALLALQKGTDRAIVVADDRLEGTDAVGTAQVLAATIRALHAETPVDLVLTGMASLDGMTSMLPATLAAELDLPYVGLASELEITETTATAKRSADGFTDTLQVSFPAVISVTDQVNDPRYPNFKAMKAARSKPLDIWSLDDIPGFDVDNVQVGAESAGTQILGADQEPERVAGTVIQDSGDAGVKLAHFLADVLK
ncbi:electron transfer flavoprotein domain protein [Gleimia coleocanis DSM 15436]|uniref:Electron transfer flavoprotein subunit beta n=1 Tax=Gleimia coleocanis DSM 15436 TaxID=525245 RepID=C0W037_9ACTO|nr:electron transfer flavoprotein subunit beta/FixA family protein [Gleimia coleocanis]EEH63896.1 electron transfer flavoprotein domain protein [Gleimia coleocanis DSM 15436]